MAELYPWHRCSQQSLLQQKSVGRLPHAMLFLGSEGLGKGRFMAWLAEYLLCQKPGAEGACGHCKSCSLVGAGSHPDLLQVVSEKASIGVDLIRQVIERLSETAHQQGARVVLIEHVQLMTESAANALLKTLEEPGQQCFLLLSADSKAQLLPTIISRCQSHVIATPDEQTALPWLAQQGCQASPAYLRLNRGAPLLTRQFIEQGLHQRLDAFLVRMLAVLKGGRPAAELIDEAIKDQLHSYTWLSALLLDLQKVMAGVGAEQLMFSEHWTELKALAVVRRYYCPDWAPWLGKWAPILSAPGLNMAMQWQAMLTELILMMEQTQAPLIRPEPTK